ncbi:MAG TPA: sigma factor-like helix-turn-helix DNA-binding protein [Aliidongia sp.]|nr:sigma factor-like helix-turn-helix DNA-binding protein [Aliidongia sp.]
MTNQREVVFLVGIEGKSYQAAASIMGIPVPAVRCHLGRARERLRLAVLGAERAFS